MHVSPGHVPYIEKVAFGRHVPDAKHRLLASGLDKGDLLGK